MAVADAELPPPMVPVVSGGPSFGSTLATSRDFRFSSFKKADVDMCQGLSSHRRATDYSLNTATKRNPFPVSLDATSPGIYVVRHSTRVEMSVSERIFETGWY